MVVTQPRRKAFLIALTAICTLGLSLGTTVAAVAKSTKKSSTRVRATAYHGPCRVCGTGKRTASGRSVHSRGVAADPRVFPLGTVLYIPGYGHARVDDTGGAIRGRRIDVRFHSHAATRHWGARAINVRVVSRPRR